MKKTSEKKYHKVIGHNGKIALINESVHEAFNKRTIADSVKKKKAEK